LGLAVSLLGRPLQHRHAIKRIIADSLKKGRLDYGYISALDRDGRTIWIADAHRGDGRRFVVHANEKLTAFLELESAIEPFSASSFL
jgi:hypothetical protein